MQALSYIAIIGVLLNISSCGKLGKCEGKSRMDYEFVLPVTISPAKDTFRVGDTIWIENSFSNQLLNHRNGKTYEVENFNFETTMAIKDLNTVFPAVSYSKPLIITYEGKTTGNYIQSSDYEALYIDYDYKDGFYRYKAAFILDKAGFYLIDFFSYMDGNKVDITSCANETLYMEYVTNNRGDNNYEMIKYSKDHKFSKLTIENYNKEGCYCFHVVQ